MKHDFETRDAFSIIETIEKKLREGKETMKDIRTLEILAKSGNSKAEFNYGMCLFCGIKMDTNYEKALYWFNRAKKNGDPFLQPPMIRQLLPF